MSAGIKVKKLQAAWRRRPGTVRLKTSIEVDEMFFGTTMRRSGS